MERLGNRRVYANRFKFRPVLDEVTRPRECDHSGELLVHKTFRGAVVDSLRKFGIGTFVLTAFLTACSSKQAQQAGAAAGPQAMPVQTVTVSPQPVPRSDEYVSTIKSRRSATINPQVPGNLVKIEVRSASDFAVPCSVTLPPCVVTVTRRPSGEIDLSVAIALRIF